jgi:ATP-binding cassette, subfamily B, beta-glucan exporter
MSFLRLYRRVVALLAPERGLAITLVLANVALAAIAFLGPLLFGRIIDTPASSSVRPSHETWQRILRGTTSGR